MSYERDKGDSAFIEFKVKEALKWYLKAREKFYLDGKDTERRRVETQIAKCLVILGRKEEALEIFKEIIEETKELLLIDEYHSVSLDLAYSYVIFGEIKEADNILSELDEEIINNSPPETFFKYWQTRVQILVEHHRLEEAKEVLEKLFEKSSKNENFKPYFYELKVIEAQIFAEEGKILEAYNNINEALKYFQSQPFERAAFEKKIILSQFIEEPEETLRLIEEYTAKYASKDFFPLEIEVFKTRLAIRAGKITPIEAIDQLERQLLEAQANNNRNTEAEIRILLASLYPTINEVGKSFRYFKRAKEYYEEQELEYKEAQAVFFYLPALLHYHSAAVLGVFGFLMPSEHLTYTKILQNVNIEEEINRIIEVFRKYNDPVREKMSLFFLLSYRIPLLGRGKEFRKSIEQIREIYKWMESRGELYYTEMIGQFLELIERMR